MYSKGFLRLNWIALILIYLVIIAGSVVRTSGSGMGCPDWPKCFGKWVPPTTETELPANYREVYGEKRVKKVEKFAKFLTSIGMAETAEKIKNDPATYEELPFNAGKTWIEYMNRWAGFLAGNAVLIILIWTIIKYRHKRKLLWLTIANLVMISVNGWFGSIVVATNLVPWVITVHMFLALVSVAVQMRILRKVRGGSKQNIELSKTLKWLVGIVFAITVYQMFLGTQVREYIDELTKQGFGRESWTSKLGLAFLIHRTFSWLVLALMTFMLYLNQIQLKNKTIIWSYAILAVELISGVLLAYADMPGLVQVSHLLFAAILFGILLNLIYNFRRQKDTVLKF